MLKVEARAKINLTLDVVGKRVDGYHELRTVMHEIPLSDELEFVFGADGVSCASNLPYIKNSSNLALRAAKHFYSLTGIREGVHIYVRKRIPVGAGLGGGSADAAAVLRVLNDRHDRPLGETQMMVLAAGLGADVPFCLVGGCALCEGIGEQITPLPALPHCYIVLIKPEVSLSTAEMFAKLDRQSKGALHPDTEGFVEALRTRNVVALAKRMYNAMEPAAERCAEIGEAKTELLGHGALGACMSGSGSSVIGLFLDRADAEKAYESCKGGGREVFLLNM